MLLSCSSSAVLDENATLKDNEWLYAKSLQSKVIIEDTGIAYDLSFRVRNTADYRYANLYILMTLKGKGVHKTLRYELPMARPDGKWTGKGSGDLFTNSFSLFTNYRFPDTGAYTIEIEQNMRDNPLAGISDIGLVLTKTKTLH